MTKMKNVIEKAKNLLLGDKLKELREYQNHYIFQRAIELLNHDNNQAMELLQKEVSECPENGYAHYWIGRLYYDNGQLGAALMAVNNTIRYLEVDKNWMNAAYVLRGKVNRDLGNAQDMLDETGKCCYDGAIKAFRANVVAYPEELSSWRMLSYLLVRDGQYEEAIKVVDEALAVHPDVAPIILNRAIALERLGRKEEAAKYFERVAVEPLDVTDGMIAAEALLHLGRKEECIENIKSSLQDIDEQLPLVAFMLMITQPSTMPRWATRKRLYVCSISASRIRHDVITVLSVGNSTMRHYATSQDSMRQCNATSPLWLSMWHNSDFV